MQFNVLGVTSQIATSVVVLETMQAIALCINIEKF